MIDWRFDQGRLEYFQIDEIRKIAVALAQADGIDKPGSAATDGLRKILSLHSGLPFLPTDYTVWRNYGRVFKCMMLAAEIGNKIVATDLCRAIAADPAGFDGDDYLAHFARRFYYPSPIFVGYKVTGPQVFPVAAVVKFLISEYLVRGKDYVTLDEIAQYLVANNVTGKEDLTYFASLPKGPNLSADAEIRQLRELVKVISQFSFLKWDNPSLYLEVKDKAELYAIEKALDPVLDRREPDQNREVLKLGSGFAAGTVGQVTAGLVESMEREFTEGKKVRVYHLRTERSTKLKEIYFSEAKTPEVCRMCAMDTAKRYPWSPHVIELHHLLPLASPVRVEGDKTSVKDLVGLCPTCHRATHRYYASWFKAQGISDFRNYAEAKGVYREAQSKVVIA